MKKKHLGCWRFVLLFLGLPTLVLALLLGVVSYLERPRSSMELSYYETLRENRAYLPALDELGDYADVLCSSREYGERKGCTLLIRYDSPEAYAAAKAHWEETYCFQEEPIIDHLAEEDDENPVRETAFDLDGFAVRLLHVKEYRLYYPKWMAFLGASDERRQLCVVYFEEQGLDGTSTSLAELIRRACGWDAALAAVEGSA